MSVGVLVVCTANICRSPLAHVMLDQHLADRGIDGEVTVASAGTHARHGDVAAELSAVIATRGGLDLSGHRSAPLSQRLLDDSAVVVTMTERHRDAVVASDPSAVGRCFALRELARLVDDVEVPVTPADLAAHIPTVIADAHRRRTAAAASGTARGHAATGVVSEVGDDPDPASIRPADDIDDPYGRPEANYLRMARELTEAITPIADTLFGPVPAASRSTR